MQKAILPFLLILSTCLVSSQHYSFETYTVSDGLAQSTVYCITQDSRGYLWLGTDGGGLCRFDGMNFQTFSTAEGLPGNIVRSLMEDSRGRLWIGTNNGLCIYDGLEFQLLDSSDFWGTVVLSLLEDGDQNVWAGTNKGACRMTWNGPASYKTDRFTVEEGLITDLVFDLHEDAFDRIWLASWGGICMITFSEDSFRIDQFRQFIHIPGSQITSISEDHEGFLWFGSLNSGAFKLKPSQDGFTDLEIFNTDLGLSDNQIWDILSDSRGSTWLASSEGGINRYSAEGFTYFREQEGLPTNQIQCLFEDQEENLWIGTNGHGLSRFNGTHFSHYSEAEGLAEPNVSGIVQDESGNYWLATFGGGLVNLSFRDKGILVKHFTEEDGLISNFLTSVCKAADGTIWFGYRQSGIGRFDGHSLKNYSRHNGLVSDFVNCLYMDSKGDLWCGTKGGVSNFNERGFLNFEESELGNSEVQAILEDDNGDIWFGTYDGLAKFERDSRLMYRYDEQEGLMNKRIHCLEKDARGNLWVGTLGGGIYLFDFARVDSLPIRFIANGDKLGSNNIFSLIFQNDTVLLVGTDKGFDRVTLTGEDALVNVRNYDESDGFTGGENNLNALYRDRNNNFWFGKVNGLTRYTPEKEKVNLKEPRLHLTGVKIWFEETDWQKRGLQRGPWFNVPQNLKLKHGENHITFSISGLSLSNPSKVRYRYMLGGLGDNWSPPSSLSEVVYQGLKPGKYTFHVMACNASGIWNRNPLSYSFTIKPPFWRTAWFLVLVLVCAGLSVIAWVKYREKQLRIKNRELETKVAERTVEIRRQKDIIELKNRDITDSILYAKRIQDALLPSYDLLQESVSDSFILFKPRDIVSGDFYWVKRKNATLVVTAADCTGHGVPGAFMSMLGISFLDEIVDKDNVLEPGKILDRLRGLVITALKQQDPNAETKDGMDLALCTMDFSKNRLAFAGAHNSLWLIRNREVTELKADRMPVAIHANMNNFTTHTFDLKEGDSIYLFSDGFPDQFGGPKGKKFKYRAFQELLQSLQDLSMEEQKKALDQAFADWKGELDQVDDVVVVGIRY